MIIPDGSSSQSTRTFGELGAFYQRIRRTRRRKETRFKVCHNPYNNSELELILKIKSILLAKNRDYIKKHQQCPLNRDNISSGKSLLNISLLNSKIWAKKTSKCKDEKRLILKVLEISPKTLVLLSDIVLHCCVIEK